MKKDRKNRFTVFVLSSFLCLFLLLTPIIAGATIIYVDKDATGAGTGTSWGNACPELGDALYAAVSGDEIWVAAGTYYPTRDRYGSAAPADNRDKTFYFSPSNSLKVYGGFDGTNGGGGGALETDLSQRNPAANVTILSGDLAGDDDSGGNNSENAYHVVFMQANTAEVLLDGFTVTAGNADAASASDSYGGGIYNSGANGTVNPEVKNCIIRGNHGKYGGGLANWGSSVNNVVNAFSLTDCDIRENTAMFGGALYMTNSEVAMLTNCLLRGNSATDNGGAIASYSSLAILANCLVTGNTAENGGGFYTGNDDNVTNRPYRIRNCTISGNYASNLGGAMYNLADTDFHCNSNLANTIIWNNDSGNSLKDIYNEGDAEPVYQNCDIGGCEGSGASWDTELGIDNGGNIDANPQFFAPVSPASAPTTAGDFHIALTSACIDAGTDTILNFSLSYIPEDDMDKEIRDDVNDIGVDEALDTDGDGTRNLDDADDDNDSIPDVDEIAIGTDPLLADTDDDGLDDYEEVYTYPTDPLDPDSDNDGMTDGWEVANGLDPMDDTDAAEHWDSDTLDNLTEFQYGTDPNDPDTDGDGMPDDWEVANALDPLTDDTGLDPDFDRITNLAEYDTGTDPQVYHIYTNAIYVNQAAAGLDNGISWANAFVSLQDALAAAGTVSGGADIWVATGTYYPDEGGVQTNGDRNATFRVLDGMAVYGGFAGTESSLDQRALSVEVLSVLDGDLDQNDNNGGDNSENAYHVVHFSGVSDQTILDGFVITGGNANSTQSSTDKDGGGIYSADGTPRVSNCHITGNCATWDGGGLYINKGNLQIFNCAITENTAGYNGGGMCNYTYALTLDPVIECSPIVMNSVFAGNFAGHDGGAMYNHAYGGTVSPTITNCTFTGNNAANAGNEIYNYILTILGVQLGVCEPQFTNCILWNDSAIFNFIATPSYAYCNIKGSGGSASWDSTLGTDNGNNIDADPMFANPAAADLRLLAGSPCLDTGNNVANGTSFDLDGEARIQNNIIDMGAYEGAEALPFANLINWNGNLVADFGDNGLWYHNGTSWNWMTNRGHVNQMVAWDGKLVVDFGSDYGLHYYDGTGWAWMSNKGDVAKMVAWNNGATEKLVVDFGAGKRVYTYNGSWSWFTNKDAVANMTVWDNRLVVDFGSGRGVYNNNGTWNWMSNKDDIARMVAWNNGSAERLVVDFGGGRRVYTYNGAWSWLTNKDDLNDMAVWNNKLVVDFGSGRRMYTYDGAWSWISNKDDVVKMVAWNDGTDKLAVDLGAGRGMYYYDGAWHWMKNADTVPELTAWGNRLAVDFGSGVGVYNYNGAWNFMKSWSTAD
ncbi:choice-of-anchor Q domain-containing protein [Desulfosudis oleivorans]|uniref:Polymorphic outer membrane protein n=1 Tax=Desulfosudis oleivorans (strain DSM 6200 / JCM 39069 / Hxd3) TaxID=96561 RepID=A9A0W6_DESOH|nr:choice-of-anchor Q domain-containing protein [Desulfosudis oleivorans]ABW67591.1 polymorphic outer membrane protein [Desulfosudis oleivorans Hxd3]